MDEATVKLSKDQWKELLIAVDCRIRDLEILKGRPLCDATQAALKYIKRQIEEQID